MAAIVIRSPQRGRALRAALTAGLLVGLLALPSGGAAPPRSVVDFSPGLLRWVQATWGTEGRERLLVWQRLVRDQAASASRARSAREQLEQTNRFINQVPYLTDQEHWGVEDYWATPVEFLASFGGDCEDYVIAKFWTLRELGIPNSQLRITYVRSTALNVSHMVLAWYPQPEADPLILDNLVGEIRPGSQRPDLVPIYSFNDEDLYLPGSASSSGKSTRVRLWQELKERMAREQAR